MTLVLSLHSRDSLWLVVDRRLSYGGRRPPIDDAMKVMNLETTDGVGLLGYAGLGATPGGTQPSEWMSAVLRGRAGLTFAESLGILSAAASRELPKYLARTPNGTHSIIIPAFVRGLGSRLYSIDNVVDPKSGQHSHRCVSHQRAAEPDSPSTRLAWGGTGGIYLAQKGRAWQRALLSLAKAHDRGKVSAHLIADQLAKLNYEAHQKVRDGSIGPRCVVVWRWRPDDGRAAGAGHQFYTGVDRERDSGEMPTIKNGLDLQAVIGVVSKQFRRWLADRAVTPGAEFDNDETIRLLAKLPSAPDVKLR